MKKVIHNISKIVASLLVICLMVPSLPVMATATPEYTIEQRIVSPGQEFTVDVMLKNSSEVYGGNFTLQYDESIFEVKGYTFGTNLSNHTKNCNLNYQSAGNLIRFTYSGSSAVAEDGTLVTLTFLAKEDTQNNASILSFLAHKVYGSTGTALIGMSTDVEIIITDTPKYYLIVTSLEKPAGEEFVMYLAIKDNSYVTSGDIVLEYDNDLLEPTQIAHNTNILANHEVEYDIIELPNGNNAISFSFSGDTEFSSNVKLLGIKFLAKEGKSGTASFGFYSSNTYIGDGKPIGCVAQGGDLTVYEKQVATSIDIGDDLVGYAGIDTFELSATFLPEDALVEDVAWESSNSNIVSVSSDGVVTLVSEGEATITATSANGLTDSIQVTSKAVPSAQVNTSYDVAFDVSDTTAYYAFTPVRTAQYTFAVENNVNGSFGQGIGNVDISGSSFEKSYNLTAGETYHFTCTKQEDVSGQYTFSIREHVVVEKLEIVSYPTTMTYYENQGLDCSGLEVKVTMSDGTTRNWKYGEGSLVDGNPITASNCYLNGEYTHTRIECAGKVVDFMFEILPNEEPEILVGDLDGNGYVTSDDAVYLLYHTLYREEYPVNQDVDFDGNGHVTSDDAIYLLYYTMMPEKYPLNK